MSNLRSIWTIGALLLIILFLFTVYPGQSILNNLPTIFQWIFRTIVFLALFSFTIYLLIELRGIIVNYRSLKKEKERHALTGEEEYSLKSLQVNFDPQKDYQQLLDTLLKVVQFSFMARTVFIYLYNEENAQYILQDYQSILDTDLTQKFKADGPLFGDYHTNCQPLLFNAKEIDPSMLVYYQSQPKVRSLMLIPIIMGQFVGFFGLDSADNEAWGQEDLDLAQEYAHLFSQFVRQIDSIDRQATHVDFFRSLCKLNFSTPLGIDLLDLFRTATKIARKFFDYDKLSFITQNDEGSLVIEYVDGCESDYSVGEELIAQGGIFEPLSKGKPIQVPNYDKAFFQFRFQPEDLKALPFRSAVGVPLEMGRNRSGGILLESYQLDHYSESDLQTLTLFGKNLSHITNRIKTYKETKKLAMIDGLTGIYNHRAFKERLLNEIERCRRYETQLTLLILDLDKFKNVNDTYGHLFGDFVLQKISTIIRGSVRTVDTVARYGGEEFAIILINTDKQECYQTAERICSNVESFTFEKDNTKVKMTISIGMASYPTDGDESQELIANADMAMYSSKREGGNQVSMYQSE